MLYLVFGVNVSNLSSLASAIVPPFFRAMWALNHARFSCIASSTCSVHHQVSDLHWWSWRDRRLRWQHPADSSGTSSGGNCSHSSHRFHLGRPELTSSSWVLNSLTPGRFQFNFRKVIFQANFSEWWLRYLLSNCPEMNATRHYWW